MRKAAVILSGCGVYDGSEIQEAVFSLLALAEKNFSYQCFAPSINQHHVVNHITGVEMTEVRNTLVEAARISRGNIKELKEFSANDYDALVIPGGFGAAKNLTKWAFNGSQGEINTDVQNAIVSMHQLNKPICGLCMGPTVIAKALENENCSAHLTVGTNAEKSPYDIDAISNGMNSIGCITEMKSILEICIDKKNKIVTAPCYMMEADIVQVKKNIDQAIQSLIELI